MDARTPSINEVLKKDTVLRIPYYQRRYVWGEEYWERFAQDMESTMDSDQTYFLGAIIFSKENKTQEDNRKGISEKYLVVDGQQRLTTLMIYMKVLHLMLKKNADFTQQYIVCGNTPILVHNHEDIAAFNHVMSLDTLHTLSGNNNIFKAYQYFSKYLADAKENRGVDLQVLLNCITALVRFMCLKLDSKEDDEQRIFDTINSLGVPLTTGELMKNFLYKSNDDGLKKYTTTWRPVFDTDKQVEFWNKDRARARQAKNSKNSNIEVFFHAFVRIKMWDFRESLTSSQKIRFVKAGNVFSTCKSFVEEFGMSHLDLADEIIEYANLFRKYFNVESLNNPIPVYSCVERVACLINATTNSAIIPYVLYVLRNVESEVERNDIFGYLETYLIRRILAGSDNKSYSDLFAENLIGNRINTCDSLVDYIASKEGYLAMPSDFEVINSVATHSIKDSTLLYYMYETKIHRNSEEVEVLSYNDYMSDKLMPTPKKDNQGTWIPLANREEEEQRKQLVETLGNSFILSVSGKRELNAVANKPLSAKVPVFAKYNLKMRTNHALGDIHNIWSMDMIRKRNECIAKGFCTQFSV